RMGKGILMTHAMRDVPAVQRLGNAMYRAQQNPAFAKNVGFVLRFERRLKNDRRANGYRPTQRVIRCLAIHILMDSETGIDASAVDALALFIEAANRWPHAFRTD